MIPLIEHLTSAKNPRVLAWRSLKERKGRLAHEAFLAEGDRMAAEALASGFPVEALLLRSDRFQELSGSTADSSPSLPQEEKADQRIRLAELPPELPVFVLPDHVFASLSDTRTPQGVAAVVSLRPRPLRGSRFIALDGVQDPGNVGTILRTADAAGLDGVLLSPECADVFSPKVLRATMGSIFRVSLDFPEDLAARLISLREEGFSVLSSQLDGEPFYARSGLAEKWVLVIGNEGNGVSPAVRAAATHRLRLPMRGGAESLNAAIAAGIMMYELMKE
jgi:TrmH family RNA methyltransferase